MEADLVLERAPTTAIKAAPSTNRRSGIEHWLMTHVAKLAGESKEDIDVDLPFSHYALDSVATVELTADIEDWLELRLSPTLVWDYPTIAVLARHLADLKAVFR